ncbi:UNVERIFIED_CONTAM: hypothetical protein GTU68_049274 [Idotea baltica]|nr:hypothetical protein [Idotea baltica]
MPVYDALYDYQKELRHVLVRHEQAASHAAEGHARINGEPGVCLATSGPGATNLVTGIADAMLDSVPLVCITGQVSSAVLGTDAFQETDIISITIPITKWNFQVTKAEEIPEVLAKAFYIAKSGRPGPVLIDVTKDAQINKFDYKYKKREVIESYNPKSKLDLKAIDQAADLIKKAERPYLLIGHGILISQAQKELKEFVEKSGIPVGSTLHGLSAFPTAHPLYTGMLGMHGNYGPNLLSNKADLIIAIGMRFDDRVTGDPTRYLNDAKVVHIEVDPAEINKIVQVDVPIIADAKEAIIELSKKVKENSYPDWLAEFEKCSQIESEKVINSGINPTDDKLKMPEAVNKLSELTNGEAIVVADVGQHQMMAARYYKFKNPDSWVTSGGLGTMGFALPASMGCQLAAPDKTVLAIIGDGSFQMNIQELATISQEKMPVKIIIMNNNYLGMVRQWQELFFENRYSFVELDNPNFVKVAEGFGIKASSVQKRENLEKSIKEMLDFDGPYLLEIVLEKEENVFPMVPAGASVSDIRLE